jgi:hypothetical protein
MSSKCLDTITIQAFLDGELPVLEMETAAAHIASCFNCGEASREMEHEFLAIGQAFEPELTLPVPTAQLRARVNAAIDELSTGAATHASGVSLLDRVRGWLGGITPQAAFGFAAALVVLVVVGAVVVRNMRTDRPDTNSIIAALNFSPGNDLPAWQPPADTPIPPIIDVVSRPNHAGAGLPPKFVPKPLDGEQPYLDTIAEMNHSLHQGDDPETQPTLRADIERNLAVLDQAIVTSQEQARKNPKDKTAAEFLYTAYQNKVEFLRTVSDQQQLYASLR